MPPRDRQSGDCGPLNHLVSLFSSLFRSWLLTSTSPQIPSPCRPSRSLKFFFFDFHFFYFIFLNSLYSLTLVPLSLIPFNHSSAVPHNYAVPLVDHRAGRQFHGVSSGKARPWTKDEPGITAPPRCCGLAFCMLTMSSLQAWWRSKYLLEYHITSSQAS